MAARAAKEVARDLIRRAPDRAWLRELTDALDREVRAEPIERILTLWGLSQTELGEMMGVSRQAVSKWVRTGLPAERAPAIADLAAATDLLDRRVKRERIPAVVRRRAPILDGRSLYDLASEGRHREVLAAVRRMFDLRRVQP